jgi:hypothetical protein
MNTRDHQRTRYAVFMSSLIEDVIAARRRLNTADNQSTRRDVVRNSFAAIEGMAWLAREHVRLALAELEQLTPVADLAMRELSYSVSSQGKPVEQVRWLPLVSAVRLVVWQAKIICPELSVAFSATGWSDLQKAIDIRNRITHPKPDQDLAINDEDLTTVESGMNWLLATTEYLMASTNLALVEYNDLFREVMHRLSSSDAEALAEYHSILGEIKAKS